MLKSCGHWLVRPVGNRSLRGALMFVVVCGAVAVGPAWPDRDAGGRPGSRINACVSSGEWESRDDQHRG